MKCVVCGSQMKASKSKDFHYIMSGLSRVYLKGVTLQQCGCGEEEVEIPNIEELHTLLARRIATHGNKLIPEEIRFLRTHLGFSGADFAKKIGTTHNTVSRWENGKRPMPETEEKMLRLMVLTMKEAFTDYKLLEEMACKESRSAKKVVFKVDRSHWLEESVA